MNPPCPVCGVPMARVGVALQCQRRTHPNDSLPLRVLWAIKGAVNVSTDRVYKNPHARGGK